MLNAELTPARLAAIVQVDIKTVQRWLTEDRVPYPVTRARIARATGELETSLWPALLLEQDDDPGCNAVHRIWPSLNAVHPDVWYALFSRVRRQLDIIDYSGRFLFEILDVVDVLRAKSAEGISIRLLLADSASIALEQRARELSAPWLADESAGVLRLLSRAELPMAVRSHQLGLAASSFRFDDTMIVNLHAYGAWPSQSPTERVLCGAGPLFSFYADAFERAWVMAV
ncbi:hypothetical protein [Microlunatus kandeliicorticis]|nr:hypothetical protein [Microlunatus kandeliicorticis]